MRIAVALMSVAALGFTTSAYADDTGMANSHDLTKSGGKTCMTEHTHSAIGSGKTKETAKRAANQAWYEYTAWEYGSDWGRLSKAVGIKVRYTKEAEGWSAMIDARPCK